MTMYREAAERIVDIYDINWEKNMRMKEACICSVENIIANAVNISLVFLITTALGILTESLIFIVTFAAIRFYSGGAHAKNYTKCLLTYLCLLLVSVSTAKLLIVIQDNKVINIICIISMVIATIINYKYAATQIFLGEYISSYRKKACGIFIILYIFMITLCILIPRVTDLNVRDVMQEIILIQSLSLLAQSTALLVEKMNVGR